MGMDVRAQACSYLRAGKVTVHCAMTQGNARPADIIAADVAGHSSTYTVKRTSSGWTCSCGDAQHCAHAAAVQLVTGHPSLARKAEK